MNYSTLIQCITNLNFFFPLKCEIIFISSSRLLVSASQDGKLIIWDSYTTNKVEFLNYSFK